jgi:hypothetical protein
VWLQRAAPANIFYLQCVSRIIGGAGGIRTLDRALQPYNGLANRRLQPLGHSSMGADMPEAGASRKRQIEVARGPFGDASASGAARALILQPSRGLL